jgi:adenylyl-sulfate kinase
MASRSPNVSWQQCELSRTRRWEMLGARGATVWLTGLPSSGKSTIGAALERRIVEAGAHAYLLDGDNLRHGICADLGFSHGDRERNVRRVGELAQLFADSGAVAVVALVSPYAHARREVRERHEAAGLAFVEVFVNTPLWLCIDRDPKGLYAQALAGRIEDFTGVDDPYEPPAEPELELTPELSLEQAADAVLELLGHRSRSARSARGGTARRAQARKPAGARTADTAPDALPA